MVQLNVNRLQNTSISSLHAYLIIILNKRKGHKMKKSTLIKLLLKEKAHNFTKTKIEKYLEALHLQGFIDFEIAPAADVFIILINYYLSKSHPA